MKTVLIRGYTSLNLGDDLFFKILIEKFPDVQFRIIADDSYRRILGEYKNTLIIEKKNSFSQRIVNRVLGLFSKSIREKYFISTYRTFLEREAKYCDAYVNIGGSIFIEKNGGLDINDWINKLIVDVFDNKPKFVIGANFGPFKNNSFHKFYSELFKRFSDVCFRDLNSGQFFENLNNVRVTPDVVFQLNIPSVIKEKGSVGLSLIDISWRKGLSDYSQVYLEFFTSIVEKLLITNRKVYLFSFCKTEGDLKVINDLLNNLSFQNQSSVTVISYDGDIDAFLNSYAIVESMFTTRFHSMVLSLLLKQNLYPVIYSKKMTNVLEDLSFSGYFSKISELNNLSPEKCLEHLDLSNHNLDNEVIERSKDCFLEFEKQVLKL